MADPAMNDAISGDLRDIVSKLADLADRVNGDRRQLWLQVDRDGFRVIRVSAYGPRYELLGYGGTVDDAVRRAEDFLHDLQVTAETEMAECDLMPGERAISHAAE